MAIKTFYSSDFPPNALRVNYNLKLKGVELDYVDINMMKGEQKTEEYTAINPEQTIPAIVLDDGTLLHQVIGMLHYLDHEYPEKPLMGKTPVQQALVASDINQIMNLGLMSIAEKLRNGAVPGFEDSALPGPLPIKQIPELTQRGEQKLNYFYEVINKRLENCDYLVGDEATQADIDLFICCNFAAIVKQKLDPEQHSDLAAHQARMAALLEL